MFGLGPQEMLIVLVIAVLLFGKRLPEVGRSLGKGLMEFKKGLNDIKSEVDSATYADSSPRVTKSYAEDHDEPTAPKFEPPTHEPTAHEATAHDPALAPKQDTTAQVQLGQFAAALRSCGSLRSHRTPCHMTTEQFRTILHQQPFRPFTIRMADGGAFEVVHPDFVALSPSGQTVIVTQPNENFSVLDLLLMSELQVSGANGASG